MTATDEVTATFEQALARDAGLVRQAPPEVPPPPERDPEAPHGRDGEGRPLAPHGTNKKTGRPNLKPAGPGRPPQVATVAKAASPPASEADAREYAEKLNGLATVVWMGASNIRGASLGKRKLPNGNVVPLVRLPDARPFAAVWHQQTPQLVAAWTQACTKNKTIAGYVDKLGGDGSWSWVLGVGIATLGLATMAAEMSKQPQEFKDQVAAANDHQFEEYMKAQIQALGLEIQEEAA